MNSMNVSSIVSCMNRQRNDSNKKKEGRENEYEREKREMAANVSEIY